MGAGGTCPDTGCLWGGAGGVLGCRGTAALSKARQAAVGQPPHLPLSKDPGLSKEKAAGRVGDWREAGEG